MNRNLFLGLTFLLFVTACSSSRLDNEICQTPFKEIREMTQPSLSAEEDYVVSQMIQSGETFLNNCVDNKSSLGSQSQLLTKMGDESLIGYPQKYCELATKSYQPVVLVEDLNGDGTEEIILYTQFLDCSLHPPSRGGLSIIFQRDEQKQEWHGDLVWPPVEEYTYRDEHHFVEPIIQPLHISDTNHRFVLVGGQFLAADNVPTILTIWEFDDNMLKLALKLDMSSWCGYEETFPEWKITEDGSIVIPAAEATSRCEARPEEVYTFDGEEFVVH